MAKGDREILDGVLKKPTPNDLIGRMVSEQSESFPDVAEVSVEYNWVDPFTPPKWFDTKNYAVAWIDPKDDIQRHRAMDVEHFRIVTRSSSCIKGKINERDFRDHGAVERQGMIMVFRPKDLDDKMRTYPVQAHKDMVNTLSSGKQEDGFEVTHLKYSDGDRSPEARADRSAKIDVVAYEEAGEEGIKQV